jgi:hypothetical protein
MMKKYIFILSIILVTLTIFTGCEKKYPIKFDAAAGLVGYSKTTLSVNENGTAGSSNIYLGAEAGMAATDVSLAVSTEGISNPAIEGTDFTLSSKTLSVAVGETAINVTPIDNSIFQGNKQFYLIISSNSKGYQIADQDTLQVTIVDDEHPLKAWIGTYKVSAASYGKPGDWDEEWTVVTSAIDGDITKLSLKGVGSSSGNAIIASFSRTAMTITVAPGQSLGDCYGYGPTSVFKGTPDVTFNESLPLIGTISSNGNMTIDLWGHKIVSGTYAGAWDVFNTTWTKQ